MDSLERYRLGVFLRFSDLESVLGGGPKKKTLRKLRGVRSWPSCLRDDDARVKGTGDSPRSIVEVDKEFDASVGEPTSPSEKAILSVEVESKLSVNPQISSSVRRTAPFSPASLRVFEVVDGMSRREKRAVREKEYTTRRLSEFRAIAATRKEKFQQSPTPRGQSLLAKTNREVNRLIGRVEEVEDTPVRYPNREIPPPFQEANRPAGRKRPLPPGYLASRDGPLPLPKASKCMTKFGCSRPQGHKGNCDSGGKCPIRQSRFPCGYDAGHSGPCHFIGYLCPDCGSPLGKPHSRPDCPTRLARARLRRST
jgi:hypothetical protein